MLTSFHFRPLYDVHSRTKAQGSEIGTGTNTNKEKDSSPIPLRKKNFRIEYNYVLMDQLNM